MNVVCYTHTRAHGEERERERSGQRLSKYLRRSSATGNNLACAGYALVISLMRLGNKERAENDGCARVRFLPSSAGVSARLSARAGDAACDDESSRAADTCNRELRPPEDLEPKPRRRHATSGGERG